MRRALGKGLSQLIGENLEGGQQEAPIDAIVPNQFQPRSVFDDERLGELAESVRQYGILQPLLVRPLSEDRFELIAGERRLRAARMAGLQTVPISIRAAGDESSLELALIENIQREDIGPMECARAYRQLMDEFGLTQEQVAAKVGKARTSIANTVRLLRLSPRIQEGIEAGVVQEGHARALLAVESEERRNEIFDDIIDKGLSVREVERAAQKLPKPAREPRALIERRSEWAALEEALTVRFGTRVRLVASEPGGKIAIEFYSDEDLERILASMDVSL